MSVELRTFSQRTNSGECDNLSHSRDPNSKLIEDKVIHAMSEILLDCFIITDNSENHTEIILNIENDGHARVSILSIKEKLCKLLKPYPTAQDDTDGQSQSSAKRTELDHLRLSVAEIVELATEISHIPEPKASLRVLNEAVHNVLEQVLGHVREHHEWHDTADGTERKTRQRDSNISSISRQTQTLEDQSDKIEEVICKMIKDISKIHSNKASQKNYYSQFAAQGLWDFNLLMANASEMRSLVETPSYKRDVFYYFLTVLITISLLLQVGVGIILIWLSMKKEHHEKKSKVLKKQVKWEKVTVYLIYVLTVVNVFVSAFGIKNIDNYGPSDCLSEVVPSPH